MAVLQVLMHRPVYGLEIIRATDLPGGTVYPMLARLEAEGWVTSCRGRTHPAGATTS